MIILSRPEMPGDAGAAGFCPRFVGEGSGRGVRCLEFSLSSTAFGRLSENTILSGLLKFLEACRELEKVLR